MRQQEWYGWHFPEMGKIIVDNLAYAKVVKHMGKHFQHPRDSVANSMPS